MDVFPILVDGTEVDTGKYTIFPDMEKVIQDPGLAIALQMQSASSFSRFIFSKIPGLIPNDSPDMRFVRDYRKHHGIPQYTKDEIDEVVFAKVCISREEDIERAISAGVRDHNKLYNPFKLPDMGVTLDERADALHQASIEYKKAWGSVSEISVKEGMPIKTLKWAWDLGAWSDYRKSVDEWGKFLDLVEEPGLDGGKSFRFREPYGVAALFTPYNAPIALGIFSITSSILAGNSTLLKPPGKVPLSTIHLSNIFLKSFIKSGLPPSILQVLTGGGKRMMQRFMDDSRVNALVWYGDSDVGLRLWSEAAGKAIQMAPELAGSDPCLVWGNDVDLQKAAETIIRGRFLGSGQACMAIKRLFVQESLHNDLVSLLVEEANKLKAGLPSDPEVTLSPVGFTALYLLLDQVDDALAKGAKIENGGYRMNYLEERDPAGIFYKPTIVTNVKLDMRLMTEEVFAPALPVFPVKSVDEAIKVANQSRFGLRSTVISDDIKIRQQWVKEIETAGVGTSDDHVYYDPYMPHLGGYKDSGIIGGKYFTTMLTRMKYVHVGPDSGFL
ncbi:aldehyde dehydrogenase family protein [Candidatus Thorarchaeota archaeon]|nr:MAG: aldehyde dehydrogenase family protein [Candidatus Thorarchaeota archaeon]